MSVGLTHWGRVTHICVGNLTIIGSYNGLSPGRRQAIIWTNVGILLIGPLGTNFSEILIEIHTLSFKKIHLKMSSGKWRPFCLGLNVLTYGLDVIPSKYQCISTIRQMAWRLKSPTYRLFVQHVQSLSILTMRNTQKLCINGLCDGNHHEIY